MKARIKISPVRAALFNISDEKVDTVRSIFTSCGIEVITPVTDSGNEKIGYLLNVPGYVKSRAASDSCTEKAELILFADLTEKTLDKALSLLRENNIEVRFKAVLTKYNRDFSYNELMEHLLAEEKQLEIRSKR